jgi:hypothetical protein
MENHGRTTDRTSTDALRAAVSHAQTCWWRWHPLTINAIEDGFLGLHLPLDQGETQPPEGRGADAVRHLEAMSTEEGQGPVVDDRDVTAGKVAPPCLEEEPSTFTLSVDDCRGESSTLSRERLWCEGKATLIVKLPMERLILFPLLPGHLSATYCPFLFIMGQDFMQVEDGQPVKFIVGDGIKISERSRRSGIFPNTLSLPRPLLLTLKFKPPAVLLELLVNADSFNPASGLGFLGVFGLEAEGDFLPGTVRFQEVRGNPDSEVIAPGGATALEVVT